MKETSRTTKRRDGRGRRWMIMIRRTMREERKEIARKHNHEKEKKEHPDEVER